MHEVNVGREPLADCRSIVPREVMSELDQLAAELRGCRVLHVNATAFGGAVGGIPLQIEDGVTGYLVSSAAECAARCLDVLAEPEKHKRMALAGKEHVRREFPTPRLLRDDLRLFSDLRAGRIGR